MDSHGPASSAAGDSQVQAACIKGRGGAEELAFFSALTLYPEMCRTLSRNQMGIAQCRQAFHFRLSGVMQTPWSWEATLPDLQSQT